MMSNEYQDVVAALERRAPLADVEPLLHSLARSSTGINGGLNSIDMFGLTICMRAAAHGRLCVIKAALDLGARIEQQNPFTRANLLHYAAQQPVGGEEIIEWAILRTSDNLLEQQIFVPARDRDRDTNWDRGNGHTVAFEAVFNNNVPVIEALLALQEQGQVVDFTTPAVHGLSPLGWALTKSKNPKVIGLLKSRLRPRLSDDEAQREEENETEQYVVNKEKEWIVNNDNDRPALKLADGLRNYIVGGALQNGFVEDLLNWREYKHIDYNAAYGRFGQPLLILVPTHPLIMSNLPPTQDQKSRYTEVVEALIARGAEPRIKEKGLMEVSAGFREVFFGYIDALEHMIQNVKNESERKDFVNEVGVFNGYTRLIDAAVIGNTEARQLLLRYRADQNIKGFNGWTASDAAQR